MADLWVDLAADQRAYGSHLEPETNRTAIREAIARHIVTDGLRVARIEDTLVGFVMFAPESGSLQQDRSRGVVQHLYVRPAYRDDGVGSRLLAAAEAELADAGVEVIAVEAMAANDAARRFYTRAGYAPHRIEFEKRPESDTDTNEDG